MMDLKEAIKILYNIEVLGCQHEPEHTKLLEVIELLKSCGNCRECPYVAHMIDDNYSDTSSLTIRKRAVIRLEDENDG